MRAGPVGLLFWQDPERLIQVAFDQGRITHQGPRCGAGAVAIAGTVAIVLQEHTLDVPGMLNRLSSWTQAFDPVIAGAFESMRDWVKLPAEEAFEAIAHIGLSPEFTPPPPVITPFVTTSVLWSIYSFLRYPDDYLAAIGTAISVGGDVDTTAAMTGAISGARAGLENLPNHLAERINDQGEWRYEDLTRLAGEVYRMSTV